MATLTTSFESSEPRERFLMQTIGIEKYFILIIIFLMNLRNFSSTGPIEVLFSFQEPWDSWAKRITNATWFVNRSKPLSFQLEMWNMQLKDKVW